MKITARADPRYYIELTSKDVELLLTIVQRHDVRSGGAFKRSVELLQAWQLYISLSTDAIVETRMVNATHSQLEDICVAIQKPGPQQVHVMARITAMKRFFHETMQQASAHVRGMDISFVSIDLLDPIPNHAPSKPGCC